MKEIDPIALARDLVRRPSVTPLDEGALDIVERALTPLGFVCTRLVFEEEGEAPVANLYARRGDAGPNFCFAGHTDVVPPGDLEAWTFPPFDAALSDGALWGRGSADMKGAIAAFISAAARSIAGGRVSGSISLLITGDEEGPAVNGTRKMLARLAERGEKIDHCIVGEPSSNETLGDMMKIGRRGSLQGWLTAFGRQGHVAYPDRAQNPLPALSRMVAALSETPLDAGYENFQPSSLQFTDIHVGNPAHNIIPARAVARFNIRFNPNWTGSSLDAHLRRTLDALSAELSIRCELKTVISGEAFLTGDETFLELIAGAVEAKTGLRPKFSTTGGTSDARFIKDAAPVAEFGLVGATIHQTDERTPVADIRALADIYEELLARYFRQGSAP